MTLQQIIDELKNIKEQAINDDNITKGSIIEAVTDIIHEVEGSEIDFSFDDDNYTTFDDTDFSSLADMD